MKIVCVSDIHARTIAVPEADVLVVSGDLTYDGTDKELAWLKQWLKEQKAKYKIFIAGNHDKKFHTHPYTIAEYLKEVCAEEGVHYLQDSSVTIGGLTFWGSPWTPKYGGVFQFKSESEAKAHWDKLPAGIDVLITHGPPHGILDLVPKISKNAGDKMLLEAVRRLKPKLHIFGHIHTGHGTTEIDGTTYVNAAICDEHYKAVQSPIEVEIDAPEPF